MGTHGVYSSFKNSLSLDVSVCAAHYTLTTLLSSVSAGYTTRLHSLQLTTGVYTWQKSITAKNCAEIHWHETSSGLKHLKTIISRSY